MQGSEVQFGNKISTCDLKPLRGKRGAPFGNRNRLVHGRYARARKIRRAQIRALVKAANEAIAITRTKGVRPLESRLYSASEQT